MKPLLIASVVTGLTAAAGTVLINTPRIIAHTTNTQQTQIEQVQTEQVQTEQVKSIPQEEYKSRTTATGHVVTAKVSNIDCNWKQGEYEHDIIYQKCTVLGVITDLTGEQKHFSSIDKLCLKEYTKPTPAYYGDVVYLPGNYYPASHHDDIACAFGVD